MYVLYNQASEFMQCTSGGGNVQMWIIIGASVSEPHTSESNWDFSYIFFLAYVVPYILNAVI